MLAKRLATVLLTLEILGITSMASAQDNVGQEKQKTIFDRLNDFGRTIFGPILPADKTKEKTAAGTPQTQPQPSSRKPTASATSDDIDVPQTKDSRAGSILSGSEATQRTTTGTRASDNFAVPPDNSLPTTSRSASESLAPVRRSPVDRPLLDETDGPAKKTASPPLHERLSALRESAFEPDAASQPVTQPTLQPERTSEAPAGAAPRRDPIAPEAETRPIVAQRNKPKVDVEEAVPIAPVLDAAANSPTPTATEKVPVAVETTPAPAKADSGGVLVARKAPVITVETVGPRRISVGKESTYEVNIANSGDVAGEELVIFVSLPEWAEVIGADASSGAAQVNATGQVAGTVLWKLGRLDAKGRERLALRIIPRQSRPFDLAVRWQSKPVTSQAMIEVQEAKLALQLDGPREVLYGKKEVYRLKVSNVGNGSADNVAIMLMPIGGGENVPATHKLGMLAAGEEKVLDVELTARQAGNLAIQVDARADGGVHAELAEKVLVRRAGLKLDVEGPKVQFVGAAIGYAICARNTGNAPTRNVIISVVLPNGAEYLSGIEGARVDASKNKLQWTIETLAPETERSFVLKCSLGAAGVGRIQLSAAADDDLNASAVTVTRVEAVANLVMDVTDPEGPVAVGEEATYEIHVRNRGTKEAEGVQVYGYFSRGIEPIAAEGAPNRLGPGQVSFQPITVLGPGAEVTLKVRARAEVAGNLIFRAEAHCKAMGTRLVSEATNLYYTDIPAGQQMASEPAVQKPSPDAMRTVTRPVPGEQTPGPPRK